MGLCLPLRVRVRKVLGQKHALCQCRYMALCQYKRSGPHHTWLQYVVCLLTTYMPSDMNILDAYKDSFHATIEQNTHLVDIEWEAVERISSTVGVPTVNDMMFVLEEDGQHAVIFMFIQTELGAEIKK